MLIKYNLLIIELPKKLPSSLLRSFSRTTPYTLNWNKIKKLIIFNNYIVKIKIYIVCKQL